MRPNIIFILADDLGSADLGCYGAADSVSPCLDQLAREGVVYSRAYANSSVCSPTRFALMTGRWQYRLRGAAEEPLAQQSAVMGLPPDHSTLPSLLREAGYATALIGKWHLGSLPTFGPLQSGYEEFFGPMGGAVDYFSHVNFSGARDLWSGTQPSSASGYLTDLISDRAVEYVARRRGGQPYFLSVHYTAPHWPWETRDDDAESRRVGANIAHLDGGSVATYRQMIRHMDEGIGRILAAIAPEQRKGTLVVFTSDNGGERFSNNWPLIGGKMDLLEGGIRVPQIVSWPARIGANRQSAAATITMDWAPTLLRAAGAESDPAYPPDGVDLAPSFGDPLWQPGRDLHWRMKHRWQAASLCGDWKYLRVEGHEYLFDVVIDPRERANQGKRQSARLRDMRDRWDAWARTMPAIPDDANVYLLWDDTDMPRPTH